MAISSGEQWRMVVGLFAVAASRKGRCAPCLREGTGCCQWFSLCRSESDPTIQIHTCRSFWSSHRCLAENQSLALTSDLSL